MMADLERFLCIALALATTGESFKRRVVGLSSCRPVANDEIDRKLVTDFL
jgi:hypothetical protein